MFKNIINIGFTIVLLSSCASGPNEYIKKSANNKYFDTGGFQSSKRAPLYNPKYINQAKRNIQQDDYDYDDEFGDDDLDEEENEVHSARYKNMKAYRNMSQQKGAKSKKYRNNNYPNLYESKKNLPSTYSNYQHLELKDEIEEIKYMLEETKKELENSKCPNVKTIEKPASAITTDSYVKSL